MRKLFILSIGFFLFSCNNASEQQPDEPIVELKRTVKFFGDTIPNGGTRSTELLQVMAGKDSIQVKVNGVINEVCQKKGCWMTMMLNDTLEMRIKFKDYGFFVPKDVSGKEAVIDGTAYVDTTSVEELKHYASDEGLSQEEIDAITKPEISYSFMAYGVAIIYENE